MVKNQRRAVMQAFYFFFVAFFGVVFLNITFISPVYKYHSGVLLPLMVLFLAGALLALRQFSRKEAFFARHDRAIVGVLSFLLFALRIVLGMILEFTPANDMDLNAAYLGAELWQREGSFAVNEGLKSYYLQYPNTLGLLEFFCGVEALRGVLGVTNKFLFYTGINSAMIGMAMLFIWALVRRAASKRAALMAFMLFALLPPQLFAGGTFYSDTMSMPFLAGTLYFAYRAYEEQGSLLKKAGFAAMAGWMAGIGSPIKMTVIIALVAAVIVWWLSAKPRRALLMTACAVGVTALCLYASQALIYPAHLSPEEAARENRPLTNWVLMGIPSEYSDGTYTDWQNTFIQETPPEQREAEIEKRIKQRLEDLVKNHQVLSALSRKNDMTFGDGTFTLSQYYKAGTVNYNLLTHVVEEHGDYFPMYRHVCMAVYASILGLCVVGAFGMMRKKTAQTGLDMCYVALFGALLFLMCWEAKGRYFFNFVPVLCAGAGIGMAMLQEGAGALRAYKRGRVHEKS